MVRILQTPILKTHHMVLPFTNTLLNLCQGQYKLIATTIINQNEYRYRKHPNVAYLRYPYHPIWPKLHNNLCLWVPDQRTSTSVQTCEPRQQGESPHFG